MTTLRLKELKNWGSGLDKSFLGLLSNNPLKVLQIEDDSNDSIDSNAHALATVWVSSINQICLGCSNGAVEVFYDEVASNKGVLRLFQEGRGQTGHVRKRKKVFALSSFLRHNRILFNYHFKKNKHENYHLSVIFKGIFT